MRQRTLLSLALGGVLVVTAVGLGAAFAGAAPSRARHSGDKGNWVVSWAASPHAPGVLNPQGEAGFNDQTVRNMVFTSVGGSMVRVRISNVYGSSPLVVGRSTIGIAGLGAGVIPGTLRSLSFDGKPSVTIPAGAEAMSDPTPLSVAPLEDLWVSIFLPDATGPATGHTMAAQDNYISGTGDFADQVSGNAYTTMTTSWYFVDGVDVLAPKNVRGAVVAVGDSITDGNESGVNANGRWPNWLARRLDAQSGPTLSVVDEGIEGNRMTADSPCFGQNALAREQRDVLGQTGARAVILFEGINDIQFPTLANVPSLASIKQCFEPATTVTLAQLESADRQFIAAAHARGVKVFGATLTPNGGANGYTPAEEAEREALNTWIRTSGAFDGVFDFDKAVRDPYDPHIRNPTYVSVPPVGTSHFNDIGYGVLADAINLKLLLTAAAGH